MHVLAAPDKFRGSANASDVAEAMAAAARALGHTAEALPLADGGEGTLETLGGATETSIVAGPNGRPCEAPWRLVDGVAVIEMARVSGLALLPTGTNDPMNATTSGTGQLIREAFDRGAHRVVLTLGGSATTDGGVGAVREVSSIPDGAELLVVCDVDTTFRNAAKDFGPQKGASHAQIAVLTERLDAAAANYLGRFGVDVSIVPGAGAAGGLAGGMLALGGTLVRGFDYIADALGLDAALGRADFVLTGEGMMDALSFHGKVVGGLTARARSQNVWLGAVVGDVDPGFSAPIPTHTLVAEVGRDQAFLNTLPAVRQATTHLMLKLESVKDGKLQPWWSAK
jgi:glycerate kinase